MKKIKNKEFENKKISDNYASLMIMCLNKPPDGGFDINEMSLRLDIKKSLEGQKNEKEIELEDAHYKKTLECFKKVTWALLSEELVSFNKDLLNI